MYVSRSESHQQNKKRRSRRIRRLAVINLAMLAVILILGAVFWSTLFPPSGTQEGNGAGAAKQEDTTSSTGTGTTGNVDNGNKLPDREEQPTSSDDSTNGSSDDNNGSNSQTSGEEGSKDRAAGGGSDTAGQPSEEGAGQPGQVGGNDQAQPSQGDTSAQPSINLAFVGDILLGSTVETTMRNKGFDFPFSGALPWLTEADLTAGNLENPITTRGVPAQNKQYVFKGSPELLPSLKDAGFDVVSLANNHTLDQGAEGLLDTIAHLKDAGIPSMGGGNNDTEAFAPVILDAGGVKVAYIGLSRVVPENGWKADKNHPGVAESYDSTRAVAAIARAKEQADLVVIMVHWGVERAESPVEHQTTLAKQYIDAGADLVIGSHPHVLQGFERYKGKWIAYSLGNFVFNVTATPRTKDTGVLDAQCTKAGDCSLKFHPMVSDQSRPAPAEPAKAEEILDYLNRISIGAKVGKDGIITAQ